MSARNKYLIAGAIIGIVAVYAVKRYSGVGA